jgi:Bax protein
MRFKLACILFTTYALAYISIWGQDTPVSQKKAHFFNTFVPKAEKTRKRWVEQYHQVEELLQKKEKTSREKAILTRLYKSYKVSTPDSLLMALKPIPISITLAQAIVESAWGTSRFYKEANNAFGAWSFDRSEPRIVAKKKREGKGVWLRKYNNLEESIWDHYNILARGAAYARFRTILWEQKPVNLKALVYSLNKYSEKGEKYGILLWNIINYNNLTQYDQKI